MKWIILLTLLIMFYFFVRNVFILLFSLENYKIHKKRERQLRFEKKEDSDVGELIDKVTNPFQSFFLGRYSKDKLENLDKRLKLAKWDKTFSSPIAFVTFMWLTKAVGLILGLVLFNVSSLMAGIWAFALIFLPEYLFRNSTNNRIQRLVAEFPEFIRIMEGYITAGMTFSRAVSESVRYVGPEWQPILQKLAVDIELHGVDDALDIFKEEVNLFEVREFISLLKLTLEQGGNVREGFESQAERMQELRQLAIEMKISQRSTMSVVIQGPMLICHIMVLGLPTIHAMTNLNM